jgi:bisphosphoglycerate-independent phosphoglycerate mutase (AlkP superfamily)
MGPRESGVNKFALPEQRKYPHVTFLLLFRRKRNLCGETVILKTPRNMIYSQNRCIWSLRCFVSELEKEKLIFGAVLPAVMVGHTGMMDNAAESVRGS